MEKTVTFAVRRNPSALPFNDIRDNPLETDGFKSTSLIGPLEDAELQYKVNYQHERANGKDTASFILTGPAISWD